MFCNANLCISNKIENLLIIQHSAGGSNNAIRENDYGYEDDSDKEMVIVVR